MATVNSPREFLESMKSLLQSSLTTDPKWTISTIREKNVQTRAKLELTFEDVKEVLMSLTTEDYCEGPLKDKEIKGDL